MSNCKKNNPIPVQGAGSLLVKNIKFSTDSKEVQVYDTSTIAVSCINDIDSASFLGVKIVNIELVFTDAISGLTNDLTSPLSANPNIKISNSSGALEVIGADDINVGFAVTQMNVRYDAASNSVKFQI